MMCICSTRIKVSKERPDSESKEARKDAESDKEVKKGGEEKLPGGTQH